MKFFNAVTRSLLSEMYRECLKLNRQFCKYRVKEVHRWRIPGSRLADIKCVEGGYTNAWSKSDQGNTANTGNEVLRIKLLIHAINRSIKRP